MPKVLYLFDALKIGGAETSTLEITSRLKKWQPIVVSIYKGTELKASFEKKGIKVYCLDINSKYNWKETSKKIQEILDIEKPDIIHSNLFMADQFARYLGSRNKIIVINSFVNDSYSDERYELLNLRQKIVLNIYKAFDRFSANRVTQFMSLTHAIVNNNAKSLNIDASNVEIIPRGRNIEAFRAKVEPTKVDELKGEYGKGPLILTVSRLLVRKGYLDAIRALKKVVLKHPDVKYLIAGKGHDEFKIKSLIKKLDLEEQVILLGNRNDVPTLLAVADIFLFPSHYEGQGGALVEAMLMEKKIIATHIPVLQESVKDMHSAKLFNYRDIDDMAEKINWAIENPEKMRKLAFAAKKDAELRFNIETVCEKHEAFYEKVIRAYSTSIS